MPTGGGRSGLPDSTYYVAMAWMNAAGEEGASAAPAVITGGGQLLLGADRDGAGECDRMERVLRDGPGRR